MNRHAFSSSLKRKDELVSRTVAGRLTRLFQTHGPAMENNRSPIAVCVLGTSSTAVLAQCMPAQCWQVYCRSLIWCAYHIPKVLVEQLQEEDQDDNWLTQFHLKMIARQMCACVCTNLHKMNKIFLTKNNAKKYVVLIQKVVQVIRVLCLHFSFTVSSFCLSCQMSHSVLLPCCEN